MNVIKKIYKRVLLIISVITIIGCGYYFIPRRLDIVLVEEINIPKIIEHPMMIFSEQKVMERVLMDESNPFKCINEKIDYSKIDFNQGDYIMSFSQELKELNYSPFLTYREDYCSYLKGIPLVPTYKKIEVVPKVFLYKVVPKQRFRTICP